MAGESNNKLSVVSIDKLGEYDALIKQWASEHTSGITQQEAETLIENMSINAVVSSSEPASQNENDVWLQEYN